MGVLVTSAALVLSVMVFYHRYFSHGSFECSRPVQFVGALFGTLAIQGGPLWWASHHRQHHMFADKTGDPHSPKDGHFRSLFTWFLEKKHRKTKTIYVRRWMKYPELRFLNRYWYLPPIVAFVAFGNAYLAAVALCFLCTTLLASASHIFGKRRYNTGDTSTNNFLIALVTMGEGWHNNHHFKPWAANHGHQWWEVDPAYYTIKGIEALGLATHVKTYKV